MKKYKKVSMMVDMTHSEARWLKRMIDIFLEDVTDRPDAYHPQADMMFGFSDFIKKVTSSKRQPATNIFITTKIWEQQGGRVKHNGKYLAPVMHNDTILLIDK